VVGYFAGPTPDLKEIFLNIDCLNPKIVNMVLGTMVNWRGFGGFQNGGFRGQESKRFKGYTMPHFAI